MGTFKSKLATLPLALALIMSAVVPSLAAEPASAAADTSIGQPAAITGADSTPSALVPLEHSEMEINGEVVVTELFDVPASLDPNTLVKQNFAIKDYYYTMSSITKTPYTESRKKEVEMEFSDVADSGNLGDNISKLPSYMEYEVDGFIGTLYLDPQTIAINVTGQTTTSSTKKETKSYNLEFNDPTQLPQSYNGLPLSGYTYTEGPYIEDSSLPQYYVYTATYSRTTRRNVDSDWTITAIYKGTATYEDTKNVQYMVTYKGEAIPDGASVVDGVLVPKGYSLVDGELVKVENPNFLLPILVTLLALAAIAMILWLIAYALKRGLISSRKITVQAQDDSTGDYKVIQKAKVNKNSPSFTIDTMQAPASRHFLCEMSAQRARTLRGKIITVFADGQVVCKHRIEPVNETDKYVFPVDLTPVDAGPIDTFEL